MNPIKELMSTHTTSQMLYKLRKNYYDEDILILSYQISRGTYEAFSAIINKEVSSNRYSSEMREVEETNE
jgi:hypothetical protein